MKIEKCQRCSEFSPLPQENEELADIWALSFSGPEYTPPPRAGNSYVETKCCIPSGYHLVIFVVRKITGENIFPK